jgi:hypothetical protein
MRYLPEQTRENLRHISAEQILLAYQADKYGLANELDRLFRLFVLVDATVALVRSVYEEIRRKLNCSEPVAVRERTSSEGTDVTPAPHCRLVVHLERSFVSLDDEVIPVGEVGAPILQALVDARGEWRTRNDIMAEYPRLKHFTRLDREIRKLPPEIKNLIKSSSRGYCLATNAWHGSVSFPP